METAGASPVAKAAMLRGEPINESSRESEIYDSLPHEGSFRLLRLLHGSEEDPIQCELFLERLGRHPRYEAISYVWGDPNVCEKIHINGHPLQITKNLEWALRRVRDSSENKILWCDAIRIDQSNVKERGHQVANMGKIYKIAQRVLISFGDDSEDTVRGAAEAIDSLHQHVNELLERYGEWFALPHISDADMAALDHLNWKALSQLTLQEWFRRAWVWQEVGLARQATIFYGNTEVDWGSLMTVFKWLFHRGRALTTYKYQLSFDRTFDLWVSYDLDGRGLRDSDGRLWGSRKFIQCLQISRELKSSDARDRVYAFLNHPLLDFSIDPDYARTAPTVYIDLVAAWINQKFDLDILSLLEHSTRPEYLEEDRFPSWCPRWDVAPSYKVQILHAGFEASDGRHPELTVVNGTQLIVRGVLLDHVQTGRPQLDDLTNFFTYGDMDRIETTKGKEGYSVSDLYHDVLKQVQSKPIPYSNEVADVKRALVFTLIGDWIFRHTVSSLVLEPGDTEFDAICDSFDAYIAGSYRNDINSSNPESTSVRPEVFLGNAALKCLNRRFFITDSGYFGLGPWILEEGDVCCVIFGAKVPFILRPLGDSKYLMIGECYLHMMHGEAITLMREGKVNEETFTLI
ncbi:hypothetical protein NA57DRAFT_81571 [Rhizodiscina lignyota]|uniref:Heterokaryon incompatibility domain-containing protein n=1 Tax=Rhizodiscina lignyota TaxID=1504668 RepID=A0A9P4M4W7_9PEZI|nr:hypothetical protein NA57DRAFT_81571 [Rhizodiscina lignyota]